MQLPRLIKKKECLKLTWFSYLLIALVFIASFFLIRNKLYPLLAPTKPVEAKIMVIEGWMNDFAIEEAYSIFLSGNYDLLITTGGPLDNGYLATHYVTAAEVGKATLIELGMDSTKILSVPRTFTLKNRTYQSALALGKWMNDNNKTIAAFNLVSLGAHTKRSWFLFQKALPETKIGVIAIPDHRYDSKRWWKSSLGSRTVITETIGYFYVYFFM
ncbi:MAG: YdcF family protein [Bacteroidales bacterium]|nr:YdcF family protein [Bacteroidales bacterium]